MKQKINYIVKVNGKTAKSGMARVDFRKLHEFERDMIAQFKTKKGEDVEILFR